MNIAKTVGENLKAARKAKGVTQKQIAAELHKYQSDYSDYETGKVELITKKLYIFAVVLTLRPTTCLICDEDAAKVRHCGRQDARFLLNTKDRY